MDAQIRKIHRELMGAKQHLESLERERDALLKEEPELEDRVSQLRRHLCEIQQANGALQQKIENVRNERCCMDQAITVLEELVKSFACHEQDLGQDLESLSDEEMEEIKGLVGALIENVERILHSNASISVKDATIEAMGEMQSPVIAIDAAVGSAGDIGLIKIAKRGVKPGAGANKKLARVGDSSIIGIIAEKSIFNFSILTATRLNIVYRMADIIAEGVADFVLDNMRRIACGENIPPHNTGNASNNLKAAE